MGTKQFEVNLEAPDAMVDFYYEYLFKVGELSYSIVRKASLDLDEDEFAKLMKYQQENGPITYTGFCLGWSPYGTWLLEPIFKHGAPDAEPDPSDSGPTWITLEEIRESIV